MSRPSGVHVWSLRNDPSRALCPMIRVSSAKVFRKEESISKKYLSKNFSTFFFFGDLDVNFVVTVFDPNKQDKGDTFGMNGLAGHGSFEIGCNFPIPPLRSGGNRGHQRKTSSWKRRRKKSAQPINSQVAKDIENCQGLRGNLTVRRLEELCRVHLPDFLFLLETKTSSAHVLKLQSLLGYDHCYLVDPVGLSGGLALFWKNNFEVEVLLATNRIINTKIKFGSRDFIMSFVYGDPVQHRRAVVWNILKDIVLNRNGGWFLVG
uniref:Endonuclease/exonuclease/phosphatase domain-containing protein n=1 Tax=Brassica oleracea TaxID=3712 RepID=A0A3P6ECS6_BRAOL|nr:unnamed protein product [Brassica oleracea]